MSFAVVYLIGLFIFTVAVLAREQISTRGKSLKKTPEPKGPVLSEPSQQLLEEYNQLPEAHKFGDLTDILHALDVKNSLVGQDWVSHFHTQPGVLRFSWDCWDSQNYRPGDCKFKDYRDLHTQIAKIQKLVSEQEHLLAVSGVQTDLDRMSHIVAGMESEARILESVNRQIKEL